MSDFYSSIRAILPELTAFRHDLHAHPELAFTEKRTSEKVMEVLERIPGLQIQNGLAGGTGIVATLNADKPGPCVMLRGDMDGLPICEMNDLPYKSTYEKRMHACGHDAHTAMVYGAIRALATLGKNDHAPWPLFWRAIFQPAEEIGRAHV